MMHARCTLVMITALLTGAMLAAAQETATGGAKLVIPERIKDFGTVPQGETLTTVFKLVNEGTSPIQVKSVRPTCGCTVVEFDKEVPAGKEGQVKAKLDTTGFSGPISKSILIVTDDAANPAVSVVIKADVQPYLELLPRPLVRFNAIQGERSTEDVTLVTDQPQSYSVTGLESDSPFLTATASKLADQELVAGRPKDQYKITLVLSPDAPPGPLSATVVIATDHPKAKHVQLRVFAVVRALVHVTPTELQFGSVEAKLRPSRNVIFVNNQADKSVEVTAAAVNDPAFETQIVPKEKGRHYEISVSIKPDADPGSRDAVLTISTSDPAHPQLTVPVRANIQ